MTALLGTELRRITARRLVRLSIIAALLGIAAAGIITAVHSRPVAPEVVAQAERRAERARTDCRAGKGIQPGDLPPGQTLEEFCLESIRPEYFYDASREFRLRGLPDILRGTSFILIVGGWLLGASFVGAEWHAGTMTTLLTWEPRRLRVLATKTLAAVVVVFALAIVLQVLLSMVLAAAAGLRGSTAGTGGAWLRELVGVGLRSGVVASLAAVMGLAIAGIGRNTAAALGIGFAYLAIGEGLLRGIRPAWGRWLLGDNAATFIDGRAHSFYGPFHTVASGPGGLVYGGRPTVFVRTVAEAVAIVVVYAAVLLVLAALSFRARDVT